MIDQYVLVPGTHIRENGFKYLVNIVFYYLPF